MYFVKRGDKYIDVAGKSFRDFFAGKLDALPGERPTISDWANHLSHDLPRGAAQALSGNARRRRRPVAAAAVAHRLSGSGCSTTTTRSTPAGTWSRAGARPSGRSCATTCRRLGFNAEIGGRNVLTLAQETLRLCHARAGAPQISRPQRPRRDALSAAAGRERSRAASRRRRNCWRNSTASGTARSSRFSRRYAYESASERLATLLTMRPIRRWPNPRPRRLRWKKPASPSRCTNTTTIRMPSASACRRRKRSASSRRGCSRR